MSSNFLLLRRISELTRRPQKRNADSEIIKPMGMEGNALSAISGAW